MENRHALVVDTELTLATEVAEREAALEMVAARPGNHRITLGADKAYDVAGFVADLRQHNVTPHVAQNTTNRRSAIDGRTTRHPGYAVSGRVRKRIEGVFGWTKAIAGFRKTRHRGLGRVRWIFTLTATSYNLVRLRKLWGPRRSHARNPPTHRKNQRNRRKDLLDEQPSATQARVTFDDPTFCFANAEFFSVLLDPMPSMSAVCVVQDWRVISQATRRRGLGRCNGSVTCSSP
jgi:hypothetical protein